MRILRHLFAGYFFALSVLTIAMGFAFGEGVSKSGDLLHLGISITMEVAIIVVALVFGKAWWVLRHEELSARFWCIAASAVSSIGPGIIVTVCVLDGRPTGFLLSVGVWLVPITIGIGGVLFGLTATAKSISNGSHPDLLRVVVNSVFLPYIGFGFVLTGFRCVLGLVKHRYIPVTDYLALTFLGFVLWYSFRLLRRALHTEQDETKTITAI